MDKLTNDHRVLLQIFESKTIDEVHEVTSLLSFEYDISLPEDEVSNLLEDLVFSGLIVRENGYITLTDKGKHVFRSMKKQKKFQNLCMSLTPDLDKEEFSRIHPSIDFRDGRVYFGVWLPVVDDPGQEKLFFVTSDRKIIPNEKTALTEKKIRVTHEGIKLLDTQWSAGSVKKFLGGYSVDPYQMFSRINDSYTKYLEMPVDVVNYQSLWVIGTYLFPLFNTFPYIHLWGIKRSGKTKNLIVTSLMSFNSIFSANTTTASLFRLIQGGRCSLFMDECETLNNPERTQDIRSILLSGYKRGSKVQRVEKDSTGKMVVEFFETFSPKIIANIKGLEDVLEDRCIRVIMQRTLNKKISDAEPREDNPEWRKIRDDLYIFSLQNAGKIKDIYDSLDNTTKLTSRDWELWKPILSIASFVNKELFKDMIVFAEKNSQEKDVENITESGECILAGVLKEMIVDRPDFYKVSEITGLMKSKFEDEQGWLNNKWVGRALGRLGFVEKRRIGNGVEYKLSPASVDDIFSRISNRPTQSTQTTQTTLVTPDKEEQNSVVCVVSEVSEDAFRGNEKIKNSVTTNKNSNEPGKSIVPFNKTSAEYEKDLIEWVNYIGKKIPKVDLQAKFPALMIAKWKSDGTIAEFNDYFIYYDGGSYE